MPCQSRPRARRGTTVRMRVALTALALGGLLGTLLVAASPAAAVPSAPTGLTASAGVHRVRLSWEPVAGATSYTVYRGGQQVAVVAPSFGPFPVDYTDVALPADQTFRYEVSAADATGEGPRTPVSVRTLSREVVYADSRLGPEQLWTMPTTGGRGVPLYERPSLGNDFISGTTVSPDGSRVAWTDSHSDGLTADYRIFTGTTSGTGSAPLTTAPVGDLLDPAWSPDNSKLAFSHRPATEPARLSYVTTAAPTTIVAIPGSTGLSNPSWDANSRTLVAERGDRLVRLYTDSGAIVDIPGTAGGRDPAVSPDGLWIAFVRGPQAGPTSIERVRVGGAMSSTTLVPASGVARLRAPSWAPDASEIYYTHDATEPRPFIEAVRPDGSGRRVVGSEGADYPAVHAADLAGPRVVFPDAPRGTQPSGSITWNAVDDTTPFGGMWVTCTLDGTPVEPCRRPLAFTGLAPGRHALVITATDLAQRETKGGLSWIVDTTAPVARMSGPAAAFLLPGTARFTFTAGDTGSGVASYNARVYSAPYNGGYSAPSAPRAWQGLTTPAVSLAVAGGREYCVQAQAVDHAGNRSAWSAPRCVGVARDDRVLATSTSGWTRATSSRYFAGTATVTTRAGATLVHTNAQTARIGLVATTCPACGSVDIYSGRTRLARLSLAAPTQRYRSILTTPAFPLKTGAIAIRTVTSGKPVQIDGIAFRRS